MSVNLGVKATVTADAEGFIAGMRKSAKAADDFAGKTKKAGRDTEQAMKKTKSGAESAARAIGAAFAGAVIAKGVHDAINAASNLSETVAKASVIFGASAVQLDAWSTTAAKAMGLSKQAALDAASTFATFGKGAGLAGDDLVGFSKKLTGLSSDLASFYNASTDDAILAVGAALRGESEPIRRFGVLLNDAALKARAMAMGLYDGNGALTAQQRVLAAQAEILAQTTDAQGDFARTADGLANSQRILSAEWKNAQAALGQALLPAMKLLVGALTAVMGWFNNLDPSARKVVITFAALAGAAILLPKLFVAIKAALMQINPVLTAVTIAVGAIIAIWASHKSEAQKNREEVEKLTTAFDTVGAAMEGAATSGGPLMDVYQGMVQLVRQLNTDGGKEFGKVEEAAGRLGIKVEDLGAIFVNLADSQDLTKVEQRYGYMTQFIKGLGLDAQSTSALLSSLGSDFDNLNSKDMKSRLSDEAKRAGEDLKFLNKQAGDADNIITALHNSVARAAANMGDAGKPARDLFEAQTKGVYDLEKVWAAYSTFIATEATPAVVEQATGIRRGADAMAGMVGEVWSSLDAWQAVDKGMGDLWSQLTVLDAEWDTGAKRAEAFGAALESVLRPARMAITSASDLAAAQEAFNDSIGRKVSKGGKVTFKAGISLGPQTAEARAATSAFLALGDAMRQDVERILETSGSYDKATNAAKLYRQQLTDQLTALGMNTTQIQEYLTAVGLTPESIETAIKLTGEQEALQKLTLFQGLLGTETDPRLTAYVMTKINENDMQAAWDAMYSFFTSGTIPVLVKPTVYRDSTRHKATGGALSGPTIVGERGTELVTGMGYVVNHQRMVAAARAGMAGIVASPAVTGSAGGGGHTYITVNAPVTVGPGGDPHEVGRVLVDVVNTYQRAGGQRFVQPTVRT